ncbi:hypothetical protein EIN_215150 [Entamoeba invadens IP1]|uniref:TLDc domain-containing protein n=1 Tax=Entamoeba invadens IP1 TaxID=370355 RepID=A0A0A1UB46_ENTIV|nr:hypothetical protein EIN_215150 [Entamoeba invadens IP1]ELP90362.1 hypothetical protein EIN_215150 [Entamoeba invadens IP1]|eukprot:XP_004257133.1 hypothetical protein EIN_215150 [Entamoeba invadens IP1]
MNRQEVITTLQNQIGALECLEVRSVLQTLLTLVEDICTTTVKRSESLMKGNDKENKEKKIIAEKKIILKVPKLDEKDERTEETQEMSHVSTSSQNQCKEKINETHEIELSEFKMKKLSTSSIEQSIVKNPIKKIDRSKIMTSKRSQTYESSAGNLSPRLGKQSASMRRSFRSNQQYSQIASNMKLLSSWTELGWSHVVYDSNIAPKTNDTFISSILNRPNLLFINYDDKGNVFGVFVPMKIGYTNDWVIDGFHFVLSLESNGRYSEPIRWFKKTEVESGIFIFENDDRLYSVGNGNGFFTVWKVGMKESSCRNLSEVYEEMEDDALTGSDFKTNPEKTTIDRVIVIQMK